MNMRMNITAAADPVARPAQPPLSPVMAAQLAPLAETIVAVLFDTPPSLDRTPDRRKLSALLDGQSVSGPMISTSLALRRGGRRHVLLLERSVESLLGRRLNLALGTQPVAEIDPNMLQAPVADLAALIDGLSDAGRDRLLRLFVSTGASLFGRESAFGFAVRRLLGAMAIDGVGIARWCPLGANAHVLSYRLPSDGMDPAIDTLVAVAADRIARVKSFAARFEATPGGTWLHVHVPAALPKGAVLVGLGVTPVLLDAPAADAKPRPLGPWLTERTAPARRWAELLIEAAAARDAGAAALMRDLRGNDGNAPELELRHLSATREGVLIAVRLVDPDELVRAVRIERGGSSADVAIPGGSRLGGATLVAYVRLAQAGWFDGPCRIRLVHWSGRVRTVREGPIARYAGDYPAGFSAAPLDVAARCILEAQASREGGAARARIEEHAPPSAPPALSLIAPVGENLDVIRARAALIRREPGGRRVEIVYHQADGPQYAAARSAIASAQAVYGIAHRIVTLARASTPSERLRAALGTARADKTLLMGADVLPRDAGWLAAWSRALGRPERACVLGGTLLGFDGSILHAGGRIRAAEKIPRLDLTCFGLPEADLPRSDSSATELVTAEIAGLTRMAVEAVLAFTASYPNPDIVLSAVAMQQRKGGRSARTQLRHRFVRYGPIPAPDPVATSVEAFALRELLAGSTGVNGDMGKE